MYRYVQSNMPSQQKQKGIATVLIVVLIGIALTAVSFGIMHSVRSTQDKQTAVHAVTHAQTGLWTGVEAFRLYLASLTPADITSLNGQTDIGFAFPDNRFGTMQANDIAVTANADGSQRVAATIVNVHNAAKSSAAVGLVFETTATGGSSDGVTVPATLNFYDDLDINGSIDLVGPATDQRIDVNVDGQINISNLNLRSIGTLSSTQSVKLENGAADVELIHSNGDVEVKSINTIVGEVQARGNVTTTGNSTVTTIKTNGNANIGGGGYSNSISAIGNISVTGGSHGTLNAGGTISWTSGGDSSALNAVGNITINSAGKGVLVRGEGSINCGSTGWVYGTMRVNGTKTNCGGTPVANTSEVITRMPPVSEFTMNPFIVDVYKLQGHANFIFTYDNSGTNNRILVRTQNINGVDDDTYMVGSYSGGAAYASVLCEIPAIGNICQTPIIPLTSVCLNSGGPASGNACLTYDTGMKKWKLDGRSAAPGIMWFEGNVNMNNGTNYTGILASGNIDTSGGFKGYSPNYAGYEKVCEAAAPHLQADSETGQARYQTMFSGRYPKNLCNTEERELITLSVGNISLAAGGFKPPSNSYSGGDIKLAGSSYMYGSVLAGNMLATEYGNINIFGSVLAANQGNSSSNNTLNGSTLVDLSSYPETYDPTTAPNMSDDEGESGGTGGEGPSVKLLWSKYL